MEDDVVRMPTNAGAPRRLSRAERDDLSRAVANGVVRGLFRFMLLLLLIAIVGIILGMVFAPLLNH